MLWKFKELYFATNDSYWTLHLTSYNHSSYSNIIYTNPLLLIVKMWPTNAHTKLELQ